MDSLETIQRNVFRVIANPLDRSQRTARTLADGSSVSDIAERYIAGNDRMTGLERLEIYNRQYWFRLLDCLYDDFPGLRAVLGERRFYDMRVAYLSQYPSRSFTLRDIGSRLGDFLEEHPEWCGKRRRLALDMVRFEWAKIVAFDAQALAPLAVDQLNLSNPQSTILAVQPYLTPLALSYPLDDFSIALHREDRERTEASSEARQCRATEAIKLPRPRKTFLVVHRFENSIFYKRLEEAPFRMLEALCRGSSLGDACELALGLMKTRDLRSGTATELIREWFAIWSRLHWFGTTTVQS